MAEGFFGSKTLLEIVMSLSRRLLEHRTHKWNPLLGSIRCSSFWAEHRSTRKSGSTCLHDALVRGHHARKGSIVQVGQQTDVRLPALAMLFLQLLGDLAL